MYYARIDENNQCIGVFGDNKERTEPDLIKLGSDIDVLGKVWNGSEWGDIDSENE